ncbi:hypothetical protein HID58_080157 [Brassica napus]|uniref:Uncharacterized protein n=1 Tax=Brassica napus TaxID=3708 RepID=A0ABQ7Y6X5_BRANA|nr:hypothetical protein HID58_080157 [Brassica napus]
MNLLGVNLKIASFMPQFHSSRSDCNLCASWVRFCLSQQENLKPLLLFHSEWFLQTTKFCVLLDIKEKTLKKLSKQYVCSRIEDGQGVCGDVQTRSNAIGRAILGGAILVPEVAMQVAKKRHN